MQMLDLSSLKKKIKKFKWGLQESKSLFQAKQETT